MPAPARPVGIASLRRGLRIALLALSAAAPAGAAGVALEVLAARLDLDAGRVTVSGLSSGAYMAHQFHVIHSRTIAGAGLIAGGPYRCADGVYAPWSWLDVTGLYAATSRCSNTNPFWFFGGPPELSISVDAARAEARRGGIDDLSGLAADRVWLFSGGADDTVPQAVVDVLAAFYRRFGADSGLRYQRLPGAGHAMITRDRGTACGRSEPPFISDCDYDAAGRLLAWLHGPLRPRASAADPAALMRFDQRRFFDTGDARAGLHRRGYVYVPRRCVEGARCALHVAFHGCQQSAARIGETFVRDAGYNEWAASNDLVVLYPQAVAFSGTPFTARTNPRGCWDWWGYSGPGYHRRDGTQPAAMARMVNALAGRMLLRVAP